MSRERSNAECITYNAWHVVEPLASEHPIPPRFDNTAQSADALDAGSGQASASVGHTPEAARTANTCDHPYCACSCASSWKTVPNLITLVRTLGCLSFAMAGLASGDKQLLYIGFAIYIVGDVLDGMAARLLDQETRDGAVFDIISDRICAVPVFLAWVAVEPYTAAAVGIWFVGFAGVDLALSLSFRAWPLRGVGGFACVDASIHRWNFTPPAKALNSSVFIVALIFLPTAIPAAIIALVSLGIKSWSLVRLATLIPASTDYSCLQRDGEPRDAT